MRPQPPLVIVVTGVSGSGKSVVGSLLARRLGWEFADGDDFHSPGNLAKMSAGQPLTDADRAPWLDRIARWIAEHVAARQPGVVACSALRRAYRDRLRGNRVSLVLLVADAQTLRARLQRRHGHFMPVSLLPSQLHTLEMPQPDEDVLEVDATREVAEVCDSIVAGLGLRMSGRS